MWRFSVLFQRKVRIASHVKGQIGNIAIEISNIQVDPAVDIRTEVYDTFIDSGVVDRKFVAFERMAAMEVFIVTYFFTVVDVGIEIPGLFERYFVKCKCE